MMVSLMRGSPPFKNHPQTAWPASWQATLYLVLGLERFFFSQPAVIFSDASSKSFSSMYCLVLLVAMIAAQLQRLAMSAPLKPGLSYDSRLARSYIFLFGSILRGLRCTLKIYSRALMSGRLTSTILSKRPGLVSAESRVSFRLVAASTMTVQWLEKPSISTSSWLRVESFSSFLDVSLFLPMASISSMKMIEGASILARANNSLTFDAPRPTNISTNYDPEMQKNVTPAYPAQALASMVLPVPGGPVKRAPLGIFAPIYLYFSPFFRKSTNSVISFLAYSMPATSANFTLISRSPSILKLFLFDSLEIIESGVNLRKMKQVNAIPKNGTSNPKASPKLFQREQVQWSKCTFTFSNLFFWQCSSMLRKLLILPLYRKCQEESSWYLKWIRNQGQSCFISSMWISLMSSSSLFMSSSSLTVPDLAPCSGESYFLDGR